MNLSKNLNGSDKPQESKTPVLKNSFQIELNSKPAVFAKFFTEDTANEVYESIHRASGVETIVFGDTPSTPHLVSLIQRLQGEGYKVVVRDHHDVAEVKTPRDQSLHNSAEAIRNLVGDDSIITNRDEHPGCSTLAQASEFADEKSFYVLDPDPDGLMFGMKVEGIVLEQHDKIAALMDGARQARTKEAGMSEEALLLDKAMGTLPPFNPQRPEVTLRAKAELFQNFVKLASGDEDVRTWFEEKVKVHEERVAQSQTFAENALEIVPGVFVADTTSGELYDIGALSGVLERAGAKITVLKKAIGPIAANDEGKVQYSLSVIPKFQKGEKGINVQSFLPEEYESGIPSGIICNTTFLAHVNQKTWDEVVAPKLHAYFA